jgi:Plasmid pRiA4b ORF-3-like protein
VSTAFPAVGKEMLFLFDYGDQWTFKVALIGLGQAEPRASYPRVVKQVGEAPPQYWGLDEDEAVEDEE